MKKTLDYRIIGLLSFLGLCIVGFIVGTFYDLQISQTLHNVNNIVCIFFTLIGVYPLYMFNVYASGFVLGDNSPCLFKKILCAIIACAFILFIGGFSTSHDGLGMFFPELSTFKKALLIIVSALLLGVSIFVYGYRKGKNNTDAQKTNHLFNLMICLILGYIVSQVLKSIVHRPRYRLVIQDLPGIEFVPWYQKIDDILLLQDKYGFISDQIRSFPSGHGCCCAVSCLVFPEFVKHKKLGFYGGILFAILVMFSRIVLGAHFLSDVCTGASISIIACLSFLLIEKNKSQ